MKDGAGLYRSQMICSSQCLLGNRFWGPRGSEQVVVSPCFLIFKGVSSLSSSCVVAGYLGHGHLLESSCTGHRWHAWPYPLCTVTRTRTCTQFISPRSASCGSPVVTEGFSVVHCPKTVGMVGRGQDLIPSWPSSWGKLSLQLLRGAL